MLLRSEPIAQRTERWDSLGALVDSVVPGDQRVAVGRQVAKAETVEKGVMAVVVMAVEMEVAGAGARRVLAVAATRPVVAGRARGAVQPWPLRTHPGSRRHHRLRPIA